MVRALPSRLLRAATYTGALIRASALRATRLCRPAGFLTTD
jgi:hypothetical protein